MFIDKKKMYYLRSVVIDFILFISSFMSGVVGHFVVLQLARKLFEDILNIFTHHFFNRINLVIKLKNKPICTTLMFLTWLGAMLRKCLCVCRKRKRKRKKQSRKSVKDCMNEEWKKNYNLSKKLFLLFLNNKKQNVSMFKW